MTALQDCIDQALEIHAERAAEAAALLRGALPALAAAEPAQQQAWLRAAEHVLLGHLADGPGLAALASSLPAGSARARAAIALAAGHEPDWQDLAPAERIRACYNAALARTRLRDFAGLRALLRRAEALAAEGEPGRAWAAMANNVAGDLRYYFKAGDAEAAGAMLEAARLARAAWGRAGGWLEQERADWQLAMCAAAAGEGAAALAAAEACVQACQHNEADDYECCFAYQALGLAALAAGDAALARRAHALMAERVLALGGADRVYADGCLAELAARLEA